MLPLLKKTGLGLEFQLSEGLFFLSCLVLLLLGAAGNVINDYFDRKVDRINKPERLIVGKLVKRRIAMLMHQGLNILALILTLVIVLQTGRWSGLLFPVLIASALWWYSPVFKKQPFIGNFMVALMVAAVPCWTGFFEIPLLRDSYTDMMTDPDGVFGELWLWLVAYAVFAFLLTLAREALKDLEDIEGDRLGEYRTLPIIWGEERSARYVKRLLSGTALLVMLASAWMFNPIEPSNRFVFGMSLLLVMLPLVFCLKITAGAREKAQFYKASLWLKLVMAGGILFTWFAGDWIVS